MNSEVGTQSLSNERESKCTRVSRTALTFRVPEVLHFYKVGSRTGEYDSFCKMEVSSSDSTMEGTTGKVVKVKWVRTKKGSCARYR